MLHLEANGPLLVPRMGDVVPHLRRSEVLDTLVVLADAGLLQLRTARGVAIRPRWRDLTERDEVPPGLDPDDWRAFVVLLREHGDGEVPPR
jgi:hypothetical protein